MDKELDFDTLVLLDEIADRRLPVQPGEITCHMLEQHMGIGERKAQAIIEEEVAAGRLIPTPDRRGVRGHTVKAWRRA